ncbi:hypothetical protein A2415_01080 [candidate division WWE3 bacterium RIFOXYC1_FULL_39_7]|uniref:Glycosyltransferase RgtA/B/C/D-like domain-containing protein n=1 Tax=candidate division WWE3 bacterium RIFOXYC1_FULL_39_7 TaxID=1802643 RepID=A0A1F4WID4_UNCKA|nr:MAG: hypothetical protein A2415_01080 [candidate division WWE3 bacterium RIFOXYC1_FULL_39_7]
MVWVVVFLVYWPVLGTYFGGDDFFHFKVSLTDGSFGGFLKLFGFYPFGERGIAFYRPFFREVTYNVFYSLFGLNILPFRLTQIALQFGNILLVYLLAKKLLGSIRMAFFSALFFGLTAANVGILYYLAGGIQAQGATFFGLLSILSFSSSKKLKAFTFFVLGLACHEMAIGIPVILMGWKWMEAKKFIWRDYFEFWLYFIILGIYLYLNIFVIGFSEAEAQYKLVFSIPKLINTLGWYGVWSLGLPEMTVDFVRSGLRVDPRLMEMWGRYYVVIWPAFFASGLLILWQILGNLKKVIGKRFVILGLWFLVGILPVLFLPIHKKTYYLALSLPGFWMGVVYLTEKMKNSVFVVLVGLLISLNVVSVKLAGKTYWAINRARVAEKILSDFEKEYPALPRKSSIYVKNDPSYAIFSQEWGGTSRQAFYALSGSDAWQLKYHDFGIKVFYEDLNERPDGEVTDFVARLN